MMVHKIVKCSEANGPGSRIVVWVQGCSRRCGGCFNPAAQPFCGGTYMSAEQILSSADRSRVTGLTVSGGEPFEQPEELAVLLHTAKKYGLDTLVFTGFTYEQLSGLNEPALADCDYLIDGPYRKNVPPVCRWTGSGNQRFLHLRDGLLIQDLTESEQYSKTGEIFIDAEGNTVVTGFLDI